MVSIFKVIIICFFLVLKIDAGTITGYVKSSKDNSSIPGANVVVIGTRLGASADSKGYYKIENVQQGAYRIKAHAIGFKEEQSIVTLKDYTSSLKLDFSLAEEAVNLAEVVINARANKETETSARLTERNANNIVNVLSAQAIEGSTDKTVADALQRVSGLSLVRSQGEGRYVIVRGLEQRYNSTLVDGIKIPSPESKDRFVPMDIFPSSLFQRIEVTKALTAENSGDAIGGSTNMVYRDAPENFVLNVNAAVGYNSGLVSDKFTSFDRSAVNELDPDRIHGTVSDSDPTKLLAPRYLASQKDFSINNLKFTDKQAPPDGNFSIVVGNRFFHNSLGLIASGSYQNTYNRSQTDFFNVDEDINHMDGNGIYIPYMSTYQHRLYSSNKTRIGATIKADLILDVEHQLSLSYLYLNQEEAVSRYSSSIDLRVPAGTSNYEPSYRSALRTQNISNATLIGNHFTKSPLSFQWTLNYTDAVQDRPDEADLNLKVSHTFNGNIITGLHYISRSWRKNDDKQYLGKIDFTYRITDDGMHTLRTGGLVQHLSRVNFQNDYNLNPAILSTGQTGVFTTIDSAKVYVIGSGGTPVFGYQNYTADETIIGSYLQYTLIIGSLQVLAGVRLENAQDKYFTMAPAKVGRNEAKINSRDILPGIHFRYEFSPEQIGRFSITRSMSRPSYFDLVPAVDRQDNSSSTGNPDLKAPHSTNIDLRYEMYPTQFDQYAFGLFTKVITDPIEDSFRVGGVSNNTKTNGSTAYVYGLETVVYKRLGDFGISFNYSYTYSRATAKKYLHKLDADGNNVLVAFDQTRPLQSQSDHVGNFILTYENSDWGLKTNLAYNYTGRRLQAVNTYDGYDVYQKPVGFVDVSIEQKLGFNFKISLKATNIFNSVAEVEIPPGEYVKHDTFIIQRDINNIRMTLGTTYKL